MGAGRGPAAAPGCLLPGRRGGGPPARTGDRRQRETNYIRCVVRRPVATCGHVAAAAGKRGSRRGLTPWAALGLPGPPPRGGGGPGRGAGRAGAFEAAAESPRGGGGCENANVLNAETANSNANANANASAFALNANALAPNDLGGQSRMLGARSGCLTRPPPRSPRALPGGQAGGEKSFLRKPCRGPPLPEALGRGPGGERAAEGSLRRAPVARPSSRRSPRPRPELFAPQPGPQTGAQSLCVAQCAWHNERGTMCVARVRGKELPTWELLT